MVGQLFVEDGTVVSHIKHIDLIADVLVFGLRSKDLLREGPHFVIGLCQRYVLLIRERRFLLPITSCSTKLNRPWLWGQPQTELLDFYAAWIWLLHDGNSWWIHGAHAILQLWHEKAHSLPIRRRTDASTCVLYMTKDWLSHYKSATLTAANTESHAQRRTTVMKHWHPHSQLDLHENVYIYLQTQFSYHL